MWLFRFSDEMHKSVGYLQIWLRSPQKRIPWLRACSHVEKPPGLFSRVLKCFFAFRSPFLTACSCCTSTRLIGWSTGSLSTRSICHGAPSPKSCWKDGPAKSHLLWETSNDVSVKYALPLVLSQNADPS